MRNPLKSNRPRAIVLALASLGTGHAGAALRRLAPHAVLTGFLPFAGQPREFPIGRHTFTADAALELAFNKVRTPVTAESEAAALIVPTYLTAVQVAKV